MEVIVDIWRISQSKTNKFVECKGHFYILYIEIILNSFQKKKRTK